MSEPDSTSKPDGAEDDSRQETPAAEEKPTDAARADEPASAEDADDPLSTNPVPKMSSASDEPANAEDDAGETAAPAATPGDGDSADDSDSADDGDSAGEGESTDDGDEEASSAPSDGGDESPGAPAKKPVPKAPSTPAAGKKPVPKAPSKPAGGKKAVPKKPAAKKPARDLPTAEQIAAWIEGDDVPLLGALFDPLPVAKLDILMMQIKKEELLPQHWQVISERPPLDDETFERLPEAGRLRLAYKDQELSRRRLGALKAAWRELAGRQPSLWTVSDLYAAIRRLLDKKVEADIYELLCAVRDVWSGMTVPHGREQLEVLWAVLDFQRTKTK